MWILPTDSIRNYVIGYDPARFCISLGLASAHADQPPDGRSVACVVVPGKGVIVSSAFSFRLRIESSSSWHVFAAFGPKQK